MIKTGIIGASGYTGVELARILALHPQAELSVVTSRQYAGKPISHIFNNLKDIVQIDFEGDFEKVIDHADLYFTAVPHSTAMEIVPKLLEAGKKVIDLSADFRIHHIPTYESWYQKHSSAKYAEEAVYGLPEMHRKSMDGCRLIANPGCYPTSVILAAAPLLKGGLIEPDSLIIDSKSGVSGAGRAAQTGSLFTEVSEGFRAYKVGEHRHTPEIEQELSLLAGRDIKVSFTPHLVPMSRGILSTVYANSLQPLQQNDILSMYRDFYRKEYFVRICDDGMLPATQNVRGSNFCDIAVRFDPRTKRIIMISAIDNLVKGAAGQAVQNMNVMCGFNERQGLETIPLYP